MTEAAGVAVEHRYEDPGIDVLREIAGGAAGGDVDGDGWPDLYVVGGDASRHFLFLNERDGTFREAAEELGVALAGEHTAGPAFADVDGDRDLDLFVGSFNPGPALFEQSGGSFVEVARPRGQFPPGPYVSASFADYDRDGDLDLFTTHWAALLARQFVDHLWRNDGSGRFEGVTEAAGLRINTEDSDLGPISWSFTGNFVDLDDDGWLDLLLASDFGLSQVFRNVGEGMFAEIAMPDVITDENGMGTAIGDFDGDGDLDWFVTSIFDGSGSTSEFWGNSGNRMYENVGGAVFVDATERAGVRDGAWGWGACAVDFDNDGDLDLYHVNGYRTRVTDEWLDRPAVLFLNRGDGTFVEAAAATGVADRGNGRGVVCFDYDRDGDVDIFVANIEGPMRLFRNDLVAGHGYLQVRLVGKAPNTEGIGARITLEAGGLRQVREIRSGNHDASQSPAVAHFGLGAHTQVDRLAIRWPSGESTVVEAFGANREVAILEVGGDANCDSSTTAADLVELRRAFGSERRAAPCPAVDLDLDGDVDRDDEGLVALALFGE